MIFSSILFCFYFLPVVLAVYYISPKNLKNLVLFISSLIFYAWGEPVYVLLMIFSTAVDYTLGRGVDHFKTAEKPGFAKLMVALSAVINLSLLGFFKYAGFFMGIVNSVFNVNVPVPELALPIGISFYTFQTMSYTIDVYRGDAKMQKNIISFGAYVSLFPQLIAGPVVRYNTIAKELDSRSVSFEDFACGIRRFIRGLAKKVLLANSVGALFDAVKVMGPSDISVLSAWLGIIAFTFQIYFDFSGYSDMAIGLGRMFGFHFDENFNTPYESKSITEFWRRWHISLGTWFREYVYIPLGGNRVSVPRHIFNLALVWFLTGLWHGAAWNFIFWGLFYGCFIILEKYVFARLFAKVPDLLKHVYTLFVVVIGWVLFSFEEPAKIGVYLKNMFGIGTTLINDRAVYYLLTNAVVLVLCAFFSTSAAKRIYEKISFKGKRTVLDILALLTFLLCTAYLVDASYNPFLYFRF
ncbi:MAG: MBOAT family protein [Lachnospiraceae bacterium]|nr:MBOAT family protein [Lachnospiraceae bacterium]